MSRHRAQVTDETPREHFKNRKAKRAASLAEAPAPAPTAKVTPPERQRPSLIPLNARQADYLDAIYRQQLILGLGPAGTGKTFVAVGAACHAFLSGATTKILLTRPAVEAGERLGFLPGDLKEKFEPYLRPYYSALKHFLGPAGLDAALRRGDIEPLPLGFMRGMTFESGWFVLLDEAQNTTPVEMKMFLTRAGEGCKIVVNGDVTQVDIKGPSGLVDAIRRIEGVPNVEFVTFCREDVVRGGLVQNILDRYATPTPLPNSGVEV